MHLPRSLQDFLVRAVGRPLFRFWSMSLRTAVVGKEGYDRLRAAGQPVVLFLWHGRMFFAPFFFRGTRIEALISPSRDGELLVQLAGQWGYNFPRGSSSHSMVGAWKDMKAELATGGAMVIVPDGPRGPCRTLKAGGLRLAQETGAYCVTMSFSARRKKILSSWDRFLLPFPFSRIAVVFGDPFTVPPGLRGEALEAERVRVERLLTETDEKADGFFART
jgi:lysophospholipid acyltransferase (LPLAT)-like uncharacterized protein